MNPGMNPGVMNLISVVKLWPRATQLVTLKRLPLRQSNTPQQRLVGVVGQMLQQTKLNPREWRQHAVFRRGRYTRLGMTEGKLQKAAADLRQGTTKKDD